MSETIDIKTINKVLSNIDSIRYSETPIFKQGLKGVEECCGGGGEWVEVFDLGLPDKWLVKLTIGTDSYGDNEFITGIQIVRETQKQTVTYEYN